MKTLTRRTALAAVPALAATPLLAAGASSSSDPLKVTLALAALIAEYERLGKQSDDLSIAADEAHARMVQDLEARGIIQPGWPPPLGSGKFLRSFDHPGFDVSEHPTEVIAWVERRLEYDRAVMAHPDEKKHQRLWREARELTLSTRSAFFEILEFEPQSFADLVVQFEQFTRFAEGSEVENEEWRFLKRVASDARRLAGVS